MVLPIGLVLTALMLRNRHEDFEMASSPFLSLYLVHHSWVSELAGLLRYDLQLVVAVIGMWMAGAIHGLRL